MKKLIVLFITILSVLTLAGCSEKEIKAADYITISTDGLNGYGTLDYEVDYSSNEDIARMEVSAYPLGSLTNGDVVNFYCEIYTQDPKDSKTYILTEQEFTYEVNGLEEVDLIKVIDMFDFYYTGVNGDALFNYKAKEDNEMLDDVYLEIHAYRTLEDGTEKEVSHDELMNGDRIEVSVKADNGREFLEKYNALPDTTAVETTVSGLGELVTNIEQIDNEVFENIKNVANECMENTAIKKNWTNLSYEIIDYAFGYGEYDEHDENILYLIYEAKINIDGYDYTFYGYVYFNDVTISKDDAKYYVNSFIYGNESAYFVGGVSDSDPSTVKDWIEKLTSSCQTVYLSWK